jgi:hypothetical protein
MDNPIGFTLRKITTEQFALVESGPKEDDIGLEVKLGFKVDRERKIIAVFTTLKFNSEKTIHIILEVGCHFKIEETAWESFNSGAQIIVPKGFMSHLSMLTVGTARGVLHAKTENTEYNKFMLPAINVTDLIKDDVLL